MSSDLPSHVVSDFYLYLWFLSETGQGNIQISEDVSVTFWVDEKIAFRIPGEDKSRVVLSGEKSAASPEAKATLTGGKILKDIRLGLRRDDREYTVTLRGARAEISGLKAPCLVKGDREEAIYERMFLIEEVMFLVDSLFRAYADVRVNSWDEVLEQIREWSHR